MKLPNLFSTFFYTFCAVSIHRLNSQLLIPKIFLKIFNNRLASDEFNTLLYIGIGISTKKSEKISPSFFLFHHLVEEFFARLFEHLNYEIEALPTLVVWIGDIVVAVGIGREVVAHTIDFVDILSCRSKAANALVVAVVHNYNAVEIFEVANAEWARAMRKAITATMRSLAHTRVGQLAGVAGVGAGRVNLELLAKTSRKDLLSKNLLRHRRTTDISKADK